ncbi:hypothetical protein QAD02_005149 [Eretmocerus hayati]|uniref:Uncharacterized protein n=1 Tax=Eretmocerus hayati TaxID=131215 RepID=A0ACC2NUH5_9HYME|nr:hypothetical protein QAD02_005149 [Eretmocerus hayati]
MRHDKKLVAAMLSAEDAARLSAISAAGVGNDREQLPPGSEPTMSRQHADIGPQGSQAPGTGVSTSPGVGIEDGAFPRASRETGCISNKVQSRGQGPPKMAGDQKLKEELLFSALMHLCAASDVFYSGVHDLVQIIGARYIGCPMTLGVFYLMEGIRQAEENYMDPRICLRLLVHKTLGFEEGKDHDILDCLTAVENIMIGELEDCQKSHPGFKFSKSHISRKGGLSIRITCCRCKSSSSLLNMDVILIQSKGHNDMLPDLIEQSFRNQFTECTCRRKETNRKYSIEFITMPELLWISVDRLSIRGSTTLDTRSGISIPKQGIEFPSVESTQRARYEVVGWANHLFVTPELGHYTALVRDPRKETACDLKKILTNV